MKNGMRFHLERRFGGNATPSNANLDVLDCYIQAVGLLLNTEGKPPINMELIL